MSWHKYTLRINVKPIEVVEKTLEIWEQFYQDSSNSRYFKYKTSGTSKVWIWTNRNAFFVVWKTPWIWYLKVVDSNWITQFLFKIIVKPLPVVNAEIFVGQTYVWKDKLRRLYRSATYRGRSNLKLSNTSLVQLNVWYRNYTIKWLKVWEVILTDMVFKKIIKLKIKPLPKPKSYNINLEQWKYINFHFP